MQVTPNVICLVAGNPSPMTLEGTNTWLVTPEGSSGAVIVDPGPDDPAHLASIRQRLEVDQRNVLAILLTHGHPDHALGSRELARGFGCPVMSAERGLADGTVVDVDGIGLEILATPGHSSDSVSILVRQDAALLTGDTILGRGTAVIAYPDGDLAAYLMSLRKIRDLTVGQQPRVRLLLPGHGAPVVDAPETVDAYLAHRGQRLDQVRIALDALGGRKELVLAWSAGRTADRVALARRIVEDVYSEVPRDLWPAAEASVLAQLDYLRTTGALG